MIAEHLHRTLLRSTPSIRRPPRSSSVASGCSPTSSTRPAKPPALAPRDRRGHHARRPVAEVEMARVAAKRPASRTEKPNLVFGGDVHVVWEKFCRYFDVEPRIVPLQPDKYTIGPADVEPHVDENTIGVAAVLGTTFTGHADDVIGINDYLARAASDKNGLRHPAAHRRRQRGLSAGPFIWPDYEWDFRLDQVRSIQRLRHKFGLGHPGHRRPIFRERARPRRGPRLRRAAISAIPRRRPSPSTSRPAPRWSSPSTTT